MRLFALILALFLTSVVARAQPAEDPAVPAIRAAAATNWDVAYALAGDDQLARDVVSWMRLRKGDAIFADYQGFTPRRADWPGMVRLYIEGEELLPPETPTAQVIDWFGDRKPESGEGAVRLAEALIATGDTPRAHAMLVDVWLTWTLSDTGHAAMIDAFSDVLAPHHVGRADQLLWRWKTDAAERMIPLLTDDRAAWTRARINFIRNGTDVSDEVPENLRSDPGLLYDRYNWLANRGSRSSAVAILRTQSTSADALGQPFRWSGRRRSLARWEMREGRPQSAYDLAANHHLTDGTSFADLEWIAGYVALTYLDDPALALSHFQTANAAVESPISVGRMQYWIGRAYAALGDGPASMAAYEIASQHQTGFYGLLASEKLGRALGPVLTGASDPTDWRGTAFLKDDMTRAAVALLQAGERSRATQFFALLGQRLDATELAQMGAMLREMDGAYYAVLLGKSAVKRGVLVPSVYFPLHDLAQMDLPAPAALSMSIARRESEFNIAAGSPVGALGLMQLMPATAQEVAGFIGEPYSRGRLTTDWAYNARLGSKYLSVLEEEFGNSPVMIAAGYNAGPSRPRAWMDERGDPRVGEVDVVDWIEHIPFRETRDYVMRVTESIPIYQARLTGKVGPVRFTDMLIGVKPNIRPQIRPADLNTTPAPPVAAPMVPAGPASVSGIRPISRPGG